MALIRRRSSNVKKICDDFVQAVHFARSLIHCIIFRHSPSFVIKDMVFSLENDCFLYSTSFILLGAKWSGYQ